MTREEAQRILAASERGQEVDATDLLLARSIASRPPERKKRLPKLVDQIRIDALLETNLARACRKVA